jgi:protocatechuate 3,4-dioxygenase beta subunit
MKIFQRAVLFLLAGIVLHAQSPASIEGVVVEQSTNNPVARVTLDLRAVDNAANRYPAITTSEGKFSFQNVLPGRYSLVASRAGYVRAEYGQRGPYSAATVLEVRAGQGVRDLRIAMIPSGAISGRVFDNKGVPAMNAQVHAWRISYAEGWRKALPVTSVITNDLGEYRVFGLPPGQYYVSAQPDPPSFIRSPAYVSLAPPLPGMIVMTIPSGGSGGFPDPANPLGYGAVYAPVYFGGSTSEFEATPITVRAGADIRGMDIPVERVPMVSLSGSVIDSNTREPVRAMLTITPLAANTWFTALTLINVTGGMLSVNPSRGAAVSANGQFRTEAVPHGSYLITAIADVGGRRLAGQAIADTRSTNPAGVPISVAPAFEVSGHIVFEGTAPVPGIKVGLMSTASQSLDIPAVAVSTDGSFVLRGVVPGHYLAQFSSLANAFVKSVRLGSTDVLNDGLRLERPPEGRLEIAIAGNPAKVSGTVTAVDRQSAAGLTSVLIPDDRQRLDLYRSVITDASGQYRFENVAPASYKLFAWEDVEKNAWLDRAFLSTVEDQGVPVVLQTGTASTIALTAIPQR